MGVMGSTFCSVYDKELTQNAIYHVISLTPNKTRARFLFLGVFQFNWCHHCGNLENQSYATLWAAQLFPENTLKTIRMIHLLSSFKRNLGIFAKSKIIFSV